MNQDEEILRRTLNNYLGRCWAGVVIGLAIIGWASSGDFGDIRRLALAIGGALVVSAVLYCINLAFVDYALRKYFEKKA